MTGLENRIRILGIGGLLAAALTLPAEAQQARSWQAFIGCWMSAEQGAGDTVLCFRPSGDGVEVSTVIDGQTTGTETLVADGRQRSVQVDGCTGYQAVEFSADGQRAFTRSELTCEGETRSNSGVMALLATDRLVHVREVRIAGEPVSWVERYRPVTRQWFAANGLEDPSAPNRRDVLVIRARAAQPITIPDVEEAFTQLGTGALLFWVAVQPSDFDLDGDMILHLADEGVPESVIDVMVAVNFPEDFALSLEGASPTIAQEQEKSADVRYSVPHPVGYRSYLFDPFYTPWFYPYNAFGYPFAPGYLYPLGYPYTTGPVTIVVRPQSEPQPQSAQGRMINGQGYSRSVSPRSGTPALVAPSGTSTVSAPSSGSTVSAPAATQGTSSPSPITPTGSAAPAPSPSAIPTGRTARPRN